MASACSSGSGGLQFGGGGPGGGGGGPDMADGGDGGDGGGDVPGGGGDGGPGDGGPGGGNGDDDTDMAGGGPGDNDADPSGNGGDDDDGTDMADGGGDGSGDGDGNGNGNGNGGPGDGDGDGDGDEGSLVAAGTLQRTVDGVVDSILTAGNALLPGASGITGPAGAGLDELARQGDSVLNPLGSVVVSNQPVLGAGATADQLVGVSALSSTSAQGELVTLNLAENGQLARAELMGDPILTAARNAVSDPAGAVQEAAGAVTGALNRQTLAGASIGQTSVGGAQPAVGVSLLSPTQTTGSVATVGLASGGRALTAEIAGTPLVGGSVGGTPVGGAQPAVGVSVLSPTQTAGSAATVGVASGGQALTANVAANPVTNNPVTGQAASAVQALSPGGLNVAAGGAQTLIGVGVASPNPPQGSLASVGALTPGGDPLSVSVNGQALGGAAQPVAQLTQPVTQLTQSVTQPVTQPGSQLTQPVTQLTQPVTQPVTQVVGQVLGQTTGGQASGGGAVTGVLGGLFK